MRRTEYEIFNNGDFLGLALDCSYFAWQNEEITDEEYLLIERRINELLHSV